MTLLQMRFAMPYLLPDMRWALTPPLHPYPFRRFIFCGTFCRQKGYAPCMQLPSPARLLSGIFSGGARTFLTPQNYHQHCGARLYLFCKLLFISATLHSSAVFLHRCLRLRYLHRPADPLRPHHQIQSQKGYRCLHR